jgi:hypothetical protein
MDVNLTEVIKKILKMDSRVSILVHVCNPSTQKAEAGGR